ncbi:hypothetical protein GCM10011504_50210 [Siccirubricoccus deserti]|nr:hypothetical protein GCM10011504_50210 [Siccirubricoccus deserti]
MTPLSSSVLIVTARMHGLPRTRKWSERRTCNAHSIEEVAGGEGVCGANHTVWQPLTPGNQKDEQPRPTVIIGVLAAVPAAAAAHDGLTAGRPHRGGSALVRAGLRHPARKLCGGWAAG